MIPLIIQGCFPEIKPMLAVKEIVDFPMGGHGPQNYREKTEDSPEAEGKTVGSGGH